MDPRCGGRERRGGWSDTGCRPRRRPRRVRPMWQERMRAVQQDATERDDQHSGRDPVAGVPAARPSRGPQPAAAGVASGSTAGARRRRRGGGLGAGRDFLVGEPLTRRRGMRKVERRLVGRHLRADPRGAIRVPEARQPGVDRRGAERGRSRRPGGLVLGRHRGQDRGRRGGARGVRRSGDRC